MNVKFSELYSGWSNCNPIQSCPIRNPWSDTGFIYGPFLIRLTLYGACFYQIKVNCAAETSFTHAQINLDR